MLSSVNGSNQYISPDYLAPLPATVSVNLYLMW